MARAVLASAMLARLREMTDTENDTHVTDTELYKALTVAVADTWDRILKAGLGGEYVKKVTFNTVANQREYVIGTIVSAGDFYKVSQMCVNEGDGIQRPISRISPDETYGYKAPTAIVPMILYYIPCAPVWTTGAESFDGINGWEEHTLNVAAMKIMAKKQDDVSPFRTAKREIEARIDSSGNRSAGEPARVVRRRRAQARDRFYNSRYNVSAWDHRGLNLELVFRWGTDV